MATHIFLVESDTQSAVLFSDNVSAFMDARVTIAHSSIDALTLIDAGIRPDVALVAWQDRDTVKLVGNIRELAPDLPIVLVFDEDQRPPRSIDELDVQANISKPFQFPQMPQVLAGAMSAAGQSPPPPGVGNPPETDEFISDQHLGTHPDFDFEAAQISTDEFEPAPVAGGATEVFHPHQDLSTTDELAYLDEVQSTESSPDTGLEDALSSIAAMLDAPLASPPLEGHFELTPDQTENLAEKLAGLENNLLNNAPMLLSQDGALITHRGRVSSDSALALARLAGRVWREGATRPTREWLSYSDRIPGDGERRNIALYSVVVSGDLTVSVAWDGSLSLKTLRRDTLQVAGYLERMLA